MKNEKHHTSIKYGKLLQDQGLTAKQTGAVWRRNFGMAIGPVAYDGDTRYELSSTILTSHDDVIPAPDVEELLRIVPEGTALVKVGDLDRFIAFVNVNPDISKMGLTPAEALAKLILYHLEKDVITPARFGEALQRT